MNIVLVEDHEDFAEMALCLLESRFGHHVCWLTSAAEALHAALSHPPDLMLIDLGLPDRHGTQLARQLRRYRELDDTILVALTGYCTVAHQRAAQRAGFDAFFGKPMDFSILPSLRVRSRRARLESAHGVAWTAARSRVQAVSSTRSGSRDGAL